MDISVVSGYHALSEALLTSSIPKLQLKKEFCILKPERDMQTETDRQIFFYCHRHSTCEQTHLKATSPSTLYSYVTNGLDIECQNKKGHLLQYCHN